MITYNFVFQNRKHIGRVPSLHQFSCENADGRSTGGDARPPGGNTERCPDHRKTSSRAARHQDASHRTADSWEPGPSASLDNDLWQDLQQVPVDEVCVPAHVGGSRPPVRSTGTSATAISGRGSSRTRSLPSLGGITSRGRTARPSMLTALLAAFIAARCCGVNLIFFLHFNFFHRFY